MEEAEGVNGLMRIDGNGMVRLILFFFSLFIALGSECDGELFSSIPWVAFGGSCVYEGFHGVWGRMFLFACIYL